MGPVRDGDTALVDRSPSKPGALKAEGLLLLAAAIWGLAFVAQRVGMEHTGPFTFNAVRFALGSGALALVLAIRRRRGGRVARAPDDRRWKLIGAGVAGGVLFLGASLQQSGVVHTTAGKAGFITGLYVVIVPLLGLFWRQRPGAGTWVGATVSVVGLYLLCASDILAISRGDSLVLAGAFFWAAHVLIIGWLTKRLDPLVLALLQFVVCSALSFAAALLVEEIILADIVRAAAPILYSGFLSVGVAYTLQVVAQRRVPPAHAAIILSLETVFAVLGGWVVLSETLSARGLAGCGLMLTGMLLSQLGPRGARAPALHAPMEGQDEP